MVNFIISGETLESEKRKNDVHDVGEMVDGYCVSLGDRTSQHSSRMGDQKVTFSRNQKVCSVLNGDVVKT